MKVTLTEGLFLLSNASPHLLECTVAVYTDMFWQLKGIVIDVVLPLTTDLDVILTSSLSDSVEVSVKT